MKKLLSYVPLLLLVQVVFCQNQDDKPNLSGTWKLVESRNIMSPQPLKKMVQIEHTEPKIKMTIELTESSLERKLEQAYFSDKRGETNSTFTENQSINTETKWKGNKLEILRKESKSLRDPFGNVKTIIIEIKEIWELSKNKNTLKHTTSVLSRGASKVLNSASGDNSPSVEVFTRL